MKTKTIAFSFMLSLIGSAVFAQTDSIPTKDSIPKTDTAKVVNATVFNTPNSDQINFRSGIHATAAIADTTVPDTTDTTKKDSTLASALRDNSNLVAYTFAAKDTTVPTDTSKKDSTLASAVRSNGNLVAFAYAVKDTTAPTDTTAPKKDSTLASTVRNNSNLVAFSYVAKDTTAPTDTSTAPKKDSTLASNLRNNSSLVAFSFAVRDTVPTDTDSTNAPKKDSTLASSVRNNSNLVAFSFAVRDTVPADSSDTTKKDSTLAVNAQQKLFQNGSEMKSGLNKLFFKNELAEIAKKNLG